MTFWKWWIIQHKPHLKAVQHSCLTAAVSSPLMMEGILIKPDSVGAVSKVTLKSDRDINELVGGHIELIQPDSLTNVFVNEEGKLKGLPLNPLATMFCTGPRFMDTIVGPAVILGRSEDQMDNASLQGEAFSFTVEKLKALAPTAQWSPELT